MSSPIGSQSVPWQCASLSDLLDKVLSPNTAPTPMPTTPNPPTTNPAVREPFDGGAPLVDTTTAFAIDSNRCDTDVAGSRFTSHFASPFASRSVIT
jgi:hypothetical protein